MKVLESNKATTPRRTNKQFLVAVVKIAPMKTDFHIKSSKLLLQFADN